MRDPDKQHPFWPRVRFAVASGQIATVELAAWFHIPWSTAKLWCRHTGEVGPWPASSQGEAFRKLALLEEAVKEKRFPLIGVGGKDRTRATKELFDEFDARLPSPHSAE